MLENILIHWQTPEGLAQSAQWRSESKPTPPARVQQIGDTLPADTAYRLACEGTGLLWAGDFQNAKLLLQALARRLDNSESHLRKGKKRARADAVPDPAHVFNSHRQRQSQRARVLNSLLIPFDAQHMIPLRRAPDVRQACEQAFGTSGEPCVRPLRELLGAIGAAQWRIAGVDIPELGSKIHAHYGVFSPLRGEYLALVAQAPLPKGCKTAADIGTGTGVLAAILARRGVETVLATDNSPRALACARENMSRLGLANRVQILDADLFSTQRADLLVCNPPWLPARPTSVLESAVYDPDSAMLRGFLAGACAHLNPGGEAWLILSDLAEHLHLRTRAALLDWIAAAGLVVLGYMDTRPSHPKVQDTSDPLHAARAQETTRLWRLGAQP